MRAWLARKTCAFFYARIWKLCVGFCWWSLLLAGLVAGRLGCWWVLLLAGLPSILSFLCYIYNMTSHMLYNQTCAIKNKILRGYLRELAHSCILDYARNYALPLCVTFPSRAFRSTPIYRYITIFSLNLLGASQGSLTEGTPGTHRDPRSPSRLPSTLLRDRWAPRKGKSEFGVGGGGAHPY